MASAWPVMSQRRSSPPCASASTSRGKFELHLSSDLHPNLLVLGFAELFPMLALVVLWWVSLALLRMPSQRWAFLLLSPTPTMVTTAGVFAMSGMRRSIVILR